MQIDLKGKRAFVSGSTQGIGYASAKTLAEAGAEIVLLARNAEKLAVVKSEIDSINGLDNHIIRADFSDTDELSSAINAFIDEKGGGEILLNNTGGPAPGPAHKAAILEFRAAFEQHLVANHILVQALLPSMQAAEYGRIINVISTSVKQPLPNLGVSNTIRGAVANWAKTLANELAPYGITVNNVLPGATATGRLDAIIQNKAKKTGISENEAAEKMTSAIPAGRFGKPEELAYAICFLASPLASYINGINVPIDGGRTSTL